jgi:methylmalonyl-CoA mutase
MPSDATTALFGEFPPVTAAQWDEAVRKDLKGADYDKRLVWRTRTGMAIKPYYRSEDLKGLEYLLDTAPGEFPYLRGTRATNDWGIREEIDETNFAAANVAGKKALAGGADEVCFRRAVPATAGDLQLLLNGLEKTPVHFWGDVNAGFVKLLIDSGVPPRGTMRLHPFTDAEVAAEFLKRSPGPGFRPVAIRRASFLESGATSIQEIGFLLAAGIDYLRWMTARGVTVDQAAQGLTFSLFVGCSYFFQIAKFRAFRMLWARVVDAFGGSKEAAKVYIFARTAGWNQSIYDPYNNVLRGTTEAMSAAIGGVDSLAVGPFNEAYRNPDDASRRLARNTQSILKQEAWMDRAVDPAAGSYYVESITDSLAREGWKLMQEVESMGGYLTARDSGMIPQQLRETRKKAEDAVAMRRRVIVGTNNYPNLKERMLDQIEQKEVPLVYGRGAEMFDDIRLRTERYAAAGNKTPVFLLAEMGDLRMRKARSGFVLNFFGCGGFDLRTRYFESADALAAAAVEMKADAVVLCSSDEEYSKLAGPAMAAVKPVPVVIAGNPKDAAALEQAGVAGFVHVRSNAVETLAAWQERLGVRG